MTTFLTILVIFLIWLFLTFIILSIAGSYDKQDVLMDSNWLTWTVMLPLTLLTMIALLVIQLLGKKK